MAKLTTYGLQLVEAEAKTGKWPVMICNANCCLSPHFAHQKVCCFEMFVVVFTQQSGLVFLGYYGFHVHGFAETLTLIHKIVSTKLMFSLTNCAGLFVGIWGEGTKKNCD